jgi:hypothetical protein
MMDVQNFDRVASDAIEDFVRVTDEWNDANAWPLRDFFRTLRPFPDPRCHRSKAQFECGGNDRVFGGNESENLVEIA